MARRKATSHPLPDWFDLSAYDVLLELTNDELIKETTCRIYLHQSQHIGHDALLCELEPLTKGDVLLARPAIYDDYDIPEMMNSEIVSIGPDFIAPGIPRVTIAPLPEPVEAAEDRAKLSGSNSISPTSFFALSNMTGWAEDRDIFRPGDSGPNGYTMIKSEYIFASVSAEYANGRVVASIDMEGFTDAEILADIIELLPLWREQLGIPEPAKRESGSVGPSVIKRLIEYRIIPMLDLMTWAKLNGFTYGAEQLARALHPQEMITAKHINDTRQPFAMKFIDDHYVDMIYAWLRQTDRDTGKRNGDRLVRVTIAGIG